jgi:hypothetical protein
MNPRQAIDAMREHVQSRYGTRMLDPDGDIMVPVRIVVAAIAEEPRPRLCTLDDCPATRIVGTHPEHPPVRTEAPTPLSGAELAQALYDAVKRAQREHTVYVDDRISSCPPSREFPIMGTGREAAENKAEQTEAWAKKYPSRSLESFILPRLEEVLSGVILDKTLRERASLPTEELERRLALVKAARDASHTVDHELRTGEGTYNLETYPEVTDALSALHDIVELLETEAAEFLNG